MRIVFFTDTYEPQINGVVTAINLFKKELEKLGHEVYIVCPKAPNYEYGKKVFALKSFTFKPYPEYRGALPSTELVKWVRKINPHIIHVHTPVTIGMMGIAIAKILAKPVIATYHTLLEEYFKLYFLPKKFGKKRLENLSKKFLEKYTRFFYNKADLITVPSLAIREHLFSSGVKKPIVVLPTGIDTDFFKPRGKAEKNLVLWVGRMGKEKSLDILLKAFELVERKLKQAKLVLVGDGPEKNNLEKIAKKLRLNAFFTGYIPREKLVKYYSRATVFVSPSVTETQGLTVLEAFACACPVVVANALGFKDFVEHGKSGFFAQPGNAEDFAEKILFVLENPKLRRKLSLHARKTAKKFSIARQAKRLETLYKKLLAYPLVSVIIPALNEEKYIEKTLKSIKEQTYPRIEIIVVDNRSRDRTKEIAEKYADKVIVEKLRGVSVARNRGAKEAKGDILLFVDADTELDKKCVENLVKAFMRDKKLVCAAGYVKAKPKSSKLIKILYMTTSELMYFCAFLHLPRFYGKCLSCRKDAFEKTHGFDENLVISEDVDLTRRISKFGKCRIIRNALAFSSSRREEKYGAIRVTIDYLINYFKYELFRAPSKHFPAVR